MGIISDPDPLLLGICGPAFHRERAPTAAVADATEGRAMVACAASGAKLRIVAANGDGLFSGANDACAALLSPALPVAHIRTRYARQLEDV